VKGNVVLVRGRVQYVRPDSLDLVRQRASTARVQRFEALVNAEQVVLHPIAADPERYRSVVPRGAPLQWSYEATLAAGPPHARGDDWACVWLGSLLAAPMTPGTDTPAVESVLFATSLRAERMIVAAPWPRRGGVYRPGSLADLTDSYIAYGALRRRDLTVAGSACSLQVAVGGTLAVPDSIWFERLPGDLAPHLPKDGRALVAVVPAAGSKSLRRARRSWLLEWPAKEEVPPPAEFYAGTAAAASPPR
jgi:hypothetical protein